MGNFRLLLILCLGGLMSLGCDSAESDGSDDQPEMDAAIECQPEASRRCHEGNPHFIDSCGNVGEQIEACVDGRSCEDGLCRCTERFGGPLACHEGDVWRMDPCGDPDYLAQRCTDDEICMNGGCVDMMCVPADESCNGQDDDCDGSTDEGELCPDGAACIQGACDGGGILCTACERDEDCREGFQCAGYRNYPELGKVCVPNGCNDGVECPEGTTCTENGLCWMVWSGACHPDGNVWDYDVCGRGIRLSEECDPERPCENDRCTGDGALCEECEGDRDCSEGYRCRGYGSFPDIPQVCVPESDCATNPNSRCPNGFQCGSTGVCWLTWENVCSEGDVWNVDTCGRMVQEAADCPEESPCQEGRCVGEGTTCNECESEADCALGFQCRGYRNYPDVPQVCVPESNCAENPDETCPEGLRCGSSGVCWLYLSPTCTEDAVDVWDYDTCGRLVRVREECGAEGHCESITGAPGSATAEGCAEAGEKLAMCFEDTIDGETFVANCEGEGSAAEVDCILAMDCEGGIEAYELCLWADRDGGQCVEGPPPVCASAIAGELGEQTGTLDGVNTFTGSCVEAEGPEQVVSYTALEAGLHAFDTAGSRFDTVLYVRRACNDPETEIGCNDDSEAGLSSRVEVELDAGDTVYAIIDAHGRLGDWILTIDGPDVMEGDPEPEDPPQGAADAGIPNDGG